MCIIARAAQKDGICDENTVSRIEALNKKYGLPINTEVSAQLLYNAALSDKKTVGTSVTAVLPEKTALCGLHKISSEKLLQYIISGTEK